MSRHINLLVRGDIAYAALIKPALLLGLAMLAMVGLSSLNTLRLRTLHAEQAQANQRLMATEAELAKIVQNPQQSTFEQQLEQMRGLATAADLILAQVGQIGSLDGLSRPLLALAKVQEKGLWLTRINIDPTKKRLMLEGNALHRHSVMNYLDRLHHQTDLQAFEFSSIDFSDPVAGMSNGLGFPADAVHFRIE